MKKIAIISNIDEFANGVRPMEIKKYLEKHGHTAEIINTICISRMSEDTKSILSKFPKISIKYLGLYLSELMMHLQDNCSLYLGKEIYTQTLQLLMRLRAKVLFPILIRGKYDLIIGDSTRDSYVLSMNLKTKIFYDCTSPWIDELYFGNKISIKGRGSLWKSEIRTYKKCDYIGFPWKSYETYVKKYFYKGNNFIHMYWSCHPVSRELRCKFAKKPRILYLGYLGGYWVNLPLLSKLSKKYTIDVYGAPTPAKKWKLNYRGYAVSKNIIHKYQFGLVTISDDDLRRNSFSSKHLDYISFGLPVLTPEWRQDEKLRSSSVYYNENNFIDQINKYSNFDEWNKLSKTSFNIAVKLYRNNSFSPLLKILNT